MKITIESTTKVTLLQTPEGVMAARIWEGETESGTPVHCFITRIAPTIPRDDPRQAEFVRELTECKPPTAAIEMYPLKMIL